MGRSGEKGDVTMNSLTASKRTRIATLCVGSFVAALVACVSVVWTPLGPRRTADVANAEPIGAPVCAACHEQVHGQESPAPFHADCESCHGPGSLHAASGDTQLIRFPGNDDCLACHTEGVAEHMEWGTSEHARAGLYCSDCHNPHSGEESELRPFEQVALPRIDLESALCVECHRDVASRLKFPSHHPVAEGALGCTSCHNAHEDRRVSFGDRNERCATCHQDYMGPWVFEHPPVVEDCMTCHNPHGAVTENLLETIQPVICLSCHSLPDNRHHTTGSSGIPGQSTISGDYPTAPGTTIGTQEARAFLRRCTDCHSAVHGSYTDEHLRH